MPRVDVETLFHVSSSGDRKIVCETLIPAEQRPEKADPPATEPDLPADSFRLPIRDEIDWVDRNAFFERKQSTKGTVNWANWNPISKPRSKSRRITSNLKSSSKPSIIVGLPKRGETGQACRSCRVTSVRQLMRSAGSMTEPGSPKVSCIGRVRPKEKSKARQQQLSSSENSPPGKEKSRFWKSFFSFFRLRRRRRADGWEENPTNECSLQGEVSPTGVDQIPAVEEPFPAPCLASLKKFASGHRSASWGSADLDQSLKVHVADDGKSRQDDVGPF